MNTKQSVPVAQPVSDEFLRRVLDVATWKKPEDKKDGR